MTRTARIPAFLAVLLTALSASAVSPPLLNCALIIDPGHGGADKGAQITDSIYEDEVNLDIARHLRDYASRHGVRVYLTRDAGDADDTITNSRQRVNRAYARALEDGVPHENTTLIALHADALFNKRLSGAMIYIPEPQMTRGEAPRLQQEKAASQHFAESVLKKLRKQGDTFPVFDFGEPIRSVVRKPDGKAYSPAVLRDTFPPVRILIEAGNARNTTDAAHLSDPDWRREFARMISAAYVEHFMLPGVCREDMGDVQKNEHNAVLGLRIMIGAQMSYHERNQCYAPDLEVLIEEEPYYMESTWARPRDGYRFEMQPDKAGYTITATPIEPGITGRKWFYTDASAVIRYSTAGPATTHSVPLGQSEKASTK